MKSLKQEDLEYFSKEKGIYTVVGCSKDYKYFKDVVSTINELLRTSDEYYYEKEQVRKGLVRTLSGKYTDEEIKAVVDFSFITHIYEVDKITGRVVRTDLSQKVLDSSSEAKKTLLINMYKYMYLADFCIDKLIQRGRFVVKEWISEEDNFPNTNAQPTSIRKYLRAGLKWLVVLGFVEVNNGKPEVFILNDSEMESVLVGYLGRTKPSTTVKQLHELEPDFYCSMRPSASEIAFRNEAELPDFVHNTLDTKSIRGKKFDERLSPTFVTRQWTLVPPNCLVHWPTYALSKELEQFLANLFLTADSQSKEETFSSLRKHKQTK